MGDAKVSMIVVERTDRHFQVWAYSVSMARLLLRSPKSETFGTRYDVLFQNVKALKLPTTLQGLVVAEAGPTEAGRILAETGLQLPKEKKIFTVRTDFFDGYVVAGVCDSRGYRRVLRVQSPLVGSVSPRWMGRAQRNPLNQVDSIYCVINSTFGSTYLCRYFTSRPTRAMEPRPA